MKKILSIFLSLCFIVIAPFTMSNAEDESDRLPPSRELNKNNPANKNDFRFVYVKAMGPSMCPTLNNFKGKCLSNKGEFILIDKHHYSNKNIPIRGEIIVHQIPNTNKNSIRRIIGLPGDIIEIIEGNVYLTAPEKDKIKISEKYLSETNKGKTHSLIKTFKIPKGQYLVLGDNRINSLDSRHCFERRCSDKNSPFIFVEEIIGRANYVIWPINRFRKIKHDLFATPAKIDTLVDEQ